MNVRKLALKAVNVIGNENSTVFVVQFLVLFISYQKSTVTNNNSKRDVTNNPGNIC